MHQGGSVPEDWSPLEQAEHRAQIVALRRMLMPGARVLDLGCGAARVMAPLVRRGMRVVGVDRDRRALRAARRRLMRLGVPSRWTLLHAEPPHDPPVVKGEFDLILLLGHTFMEVHDLDEALHLVRWAAWRLLPGGAIVLDDLPALWREVAEGNWQQGVSEDGQSQLIWEASRPVFTIRSGAAVRSEDWSINPDERRFRLWTIGELALLSRLARLLPPERDAESGLLLLARPHE